MNLMLLLAATVWMAPNGNDATGDGSARKPVATLKRAVEITRTVLTDEDRKIVVKDGLYRFGERCRFAAGDSDLTLEAEHKGKAIFTGARAVTGWKADPKDKQSDWREFFKAIPHEDGDHGTFYTNRYFDEVK